MNQLPLGNKNIRNRERRTHPTIHTDTPDFDISVVVMGFSTTIGIVAFAGVDRHNGSVIVSCDE